MWGGVKIRTQYAEIFRSWSASQRLEVLRRQLYKEPRPWYLFWRLHQHRHLLGDHHCARVLSWCASIVQLERRPVARRQAYMYGQQVFQLMVHSHKVGHESYQEFFRLCAVGRDLTTAFRWQQYLVEAGESSPMHHYTWLLTIAALSPNDESAEDMAEAVWETYMARYCSTVRNELTGETAIAHFQPSTDEEREQLDKLFRSFVALRPRIRSDANPKLVEFIDSLPTSITTGNPGTSWPTTSRHHIFPHLEAGVGWEGATLERPCLRDSILNAQFVEDLEKEAFVGNTRGVVALVQEYRGRVVAEKERASAVRFRAGERDIWQHYSDPTAVDFRKLLVEEGGVTAELYHYLIVAMSTLQPSLALRTLGRMKESKLRVLDLTRAVMIVRCEGLPQEQLSLLRDQLKEMEERRKIDEDYQITREVELFWKFNYAEFLHYRNALHREALYQILLEGLGAVRVQQLLLESEACGACSPVDVVVVDKDFREAAAKYYRRSRGKTEVDKALDEITHHLPKLDISLVGSCEHFSNYALPEEDFVATDIASLARKLTGYDTVYVLDSSFVESSEAFLFLGHSGSSGTSANRSLILVPLCCLQQLSSAFDQSSEFVSYDEALQEANQTEPFIASQRLRSLFSLLASQNNTVKARVLHFSECLLSHTVVANDSNAVQLQPAVSDNDHFLMVLAMIRAVTPASTEVVACTDDMQLVGRLSDKGFASFFAAEVRVISSEPPKDVVLLDEGLINDSPEICVPSNFEPVLNFPMPRPNETPSMTTNAPVVSLPITKPESDAAPWLDMLENDGLEKRESATSDTPLRKAEGTTTSETDDAQRYLKLMDTYESEHSIVPVGVHMAAASSLGSVFEQFDAISPDEAFEREITRATMIATAQSEGAGSGTGTGNRPRRRSLLEKEELKNKGKSGRQRYRLARRLSNLVGGRVPFNFRYKVIEVDIRNQNNKAFGDAYRAAVAKKREFFKKTLQNH
ncbi:hypothetical protein ERJ75_000706200 [Trypanosoma vivax]|uniref:Uncharacterized protein n=1 Tax=Trypanosoma vivax (strain Y486) TaxID=1055687 RepID=G0TU22_TRYVY|nr:hypothetical protein TRVL_00174 [Trypanosoma vivax]KAH8613962.1 hypothetical protein ERJ75_000706200 [Trypanosoma vivax]CCC47455.1 conserved hypothetical protein [Trypanosoma vivax Y486]